MKKTEIKFRADGNSVIGLGHLVRCFALARMLQDEFEIHFCSLDAPERFLSDLQNQGFHFSRITSDDDFINTLRGDEIVVVDHYRFTAELQMAVRNTGCKLACIDDMHDREFFADLIINHAPGIKVSDYRAQPYTQFALGPEYALLRPPFLNSAQINLDSSKREGLFLSFGGADGNNLCKYFTNLLEAINYTSPIHVLPGKHTYFDNFPANQTIHSWLSDNDVCNLMAECKYALVPASTLAMEANAVGLQVLSGYYVDNQTFAAHHLHVAGAVWSLGNLNGVNADGLRDAICAIEEKTVHLKKIIDGQQASRYIRVFQQLI